MRKIKFKQAIQEATEQMMKLDQNIIILGEGVDDKGRIFGTTQNLLELFGPKRVFDTPLAESAITGFGIGCALTGLRPIITHQRMDFMYLTMDELLNHAAKWRFMFGGTEKVPLVIRVIIGKGWGQGSQHSQCLHSIFMHVPGIKVVMPTTPYEAKGLLISSIKDNNPVIFIEHRWLHEKEGEVPEEYYELPLEKAQIVKEGKDITIIATSLMVLEVIDAAKELEKEGIDVEIINPLTLAPLDKNTIIESIKKTGRAITVDNGWLTCGFSAEIGAIISEEGIKLKSPYKRMGFKNTPTPGSAILEEDYYPKKEEIIENIKRLINKI